MLNYSLLEVQNFMIVTIGRIKEKVIYISNKSEVEIKRVEN
jgi:hypothetical protein